MSHYLPTSPRNKLKKRLTWGRRSKKKLRQIAKGEGVAGREWKLRWKNSKALGISPFPGNPSEWDKNKVLLVHWSNLYDSIYEHPERPPTEVIEDDRELDEWLKQQHEQQEMKAKENYHSKTKNSSRDIATAWQHEEVISINR